MPSKYEKWYHFEVRSKLKRFIRMFAVSSLKPATIPHPLMTPKQQERLQNKIKKIKAALAADKKYWGGYYHDGGGLRYVPPGLYIQLGDYSGGLRYLNWFKKTFPDDAGFPDFLFQWTLILFKKGKLKEAEKKAFETFTRNTYLFDKFFGRTIVPIDKWEGSLLESAEFAIRHFEYSASIEEFNDFAAWLEGLTQTERFIQLSKNYIEIYKQLKQEDDPKKRGRLLDRAAQLENKL